MKLAWLVLCVGMFQVAAQLEITDNGNCVIGKCTKCAYVTGGFSCSSCLHSKRYIVDNKEGEEFLHFSCSKDKISIEDCIELQELPNGEGDASKCARCRWGYTLTPDQTKCKVI